MKSYEFNRKIHLMLSMALFWLVAISPIKAKELKGEVTKELYTSLTKQIQCKLPLINGQEELSDDYAFESEKLSGNFDGAVASISLTQNTLPQAGQFKYITKSMNSEQKLDAIEKYWKEAFSLGSNKSKFINENITLNGETYRLLMGSLLVDEKPLNSQVYLFTLRNNQIKVYMFSDFGEVAFLSLKKRVLLLHQKCENM